ncbi:hypothetical protein [Anaerorhabdus sp.]|jgi:hypothetical protein|uniref:hypothetical protein n=1 Tax=Anaerorhabdus sp. TaxID=1872524 RepID=UPI002FCAEB02
MIRKKREISRLVYVIGFLIIVAGVLLSLSLTQQRLDEEGTKRLQEAIQRAAITCYSNEGIYPSSVDYLVENYGVYIDTNKYHVFYETIGANIQPEIKVYQR